MRLLLLGAIFFGQLGCAQRIRNHHDGRDGRAGCLDFGHDGRAGQYRKALAAVLLGDQQGEEAIFCQEVEHGIRHLARARHLPGVAHRNQLLAGAVQKRLFLGRELAVVLCEQRLEVRIAFEELAFGPDIASLQCLTLGIRQPRKHAGILHAHHDGLEHCDLLGYPGSESRRECARSCRRPRPWRPDARPG